VAQADEVTVGLFGSVRLAAPHEGNRDFRPWHESSAEHHQAAVNRSALAKRRTVRRTVEAAFAEQRRGLLT